MTFNFASSERSLHINQEGQILGYLLTAVQKIEDLIASEQLELVIEVVYSAYKGRRDVLIQSSKHISDKQTCRQFEGKHQLERLLGD